jgi:hypothetical protein
VETIAAALSEARDAIEEVIEPFLLQQGLILRTPRGRMLGQKAWQGMIAKSCGVWEDLSGKFRKELEGASALGDEGCATLLQALFPPTNRGAFAEK